MIAATTGVPARAYRIGLDGRNIRLPQGTGVATYARALSTACSRLGHQPQLVLDTMGEASSPGHRGQRLLRAALPWRTLRPLPREEPDPPPLFSPDLFRVAQVHFDLYRRPLRLRCAAPPAIMHWTYPLPLHMPGTVNLITVHDLIPLISPHLTGIPSGRMRRLLRMATRAAHGVVTVSEHVRNELIATFGLSPEKVVNLHQAVELPGTLLRDAARAPRLCPPGSFVSIGRIESRKNIRRLIAAHEASVVTAPLVLIGPDGPDAAGELSAATGGPGGAARLIRIPWASRPSLIRTIQEARAMLFPSLAEGFGLPVAEAMMLGTPVMTASGGATAEIAGGAALLVDPLDVRDMARAIQALDREPELRDRLRAHGLVRARLFSMEAYAARLGAFYDRFLGLSVKPSIR